MNEHLNTRVNGSGQDTITSAAKADDILTPNQVAAIVTRVFTASFMTAVEFAGCDYAAATDIAAKVVHEAIRSAIEGRAP